MDPAPWHHRSDDHLWREQRYDLSRSWDQEQDAFRPGPQVRILCHSTCGPQVFSSRKETSNDIIFFQAGIHQRKRWFAGEWNLQRSQKNKDSSFMFKLVDCWFSWDVESCRWVLWPCRDCHCSHIKVGCLQTKHSQIEQDFIDFLFQNEQDDLGQISPKEDSDEGFDPSTRDRQVDHTLSQT